MFQKNEYELIDFGGEEKLEWFGGKTVRRPTPSAQGTQGLSNWPDAGVSATKLDTKVKWNCENPVDWTLRHRSFEFQLRLTPTGQLGVFPEQAVNWDWILDAPNEFEGLKAINLFAYTGGTTMALASKGAEVVHVDSAKSVVNWARENAQSSGLGDARIRWIVEDALKFVRREIKRGNRYDIVVADPPSFGRGPGGESWKIQRDLDELAELLAQLTADECKMILLSCHTPGVGYRDLADAVSRHFDLAGGKTDSFELIIPARSGKRLFSGDCFRWSKFAR